MSSATIPFFFGLFLFFKLFIRSKCQPFAVSEKQQKKQAQPAIELGAGEVPEAGG